MRQRNNVLAKLVLILGSNQISSHKRAKMLSKNNIQLITSLQAKKFRLKHNLFIAEGPKVLEELLKKPNMVERVYHTPDYTLPIKANFFEEISDKELQKISTLKTPNQVLALVKIKEPEFNGATLKNQLVLGLESVRDPGNLGTIIRMADWFGIENILCSDDCVDLYNPKTVQASMGSMFRVSVHYVNLLDALGILKEQQPVYATSLDGDNIYTTELAKNGILVIGNEANGITEEMMELANKRIHIPSFNKSSDKAESLNAAFACAIACSEFRRR